MTTPEIIRHNGLDAVQGYFVTRAGRSVESEKAFFQNRFFALFLARGMTPENARKIFRMLWMDRENPLLTKLLKELLCRTTS
jgi:hypothetical protein